MQYSDTKNGFMIRFSKGEEIASSIASFCAAHNVTSGYFQAIGAVTEVELGYYHLEKKEYTFKQFEQEFEVVSLTGNVSLVEGKPFVHMHGVFSDEHFQCTGGHVKNGIVGATCEVYFVPFETELIREFDEEIGLKLLHCPLQ